MTVICMASYQIYCWNNKSFSHMITCISSWLTRSYFWNYVCQNWVIFGIKKLFILRWFLLGFDFALDDSIKNVNKSLFLACPLFRLFLKKRKFSLIYENQLNLRKFPFALNIKTGTELAKIEKIYRKHAIITCGLYFLNPLFDGQIQGILFRKFCLYVWLVFKSKF